MRQLAIKSGDAFILAFSVDDSESFEEVRRLRDMILEIKTSDNNDMPSIAPAIVVVGNKNDLEDKRVIRKVLFAILF
jgi:GTPase SAR1 family protein